MAIPQPRSLYSVTSLRFQCCGTEQETSAIPRWAILAVLPNSNCGSFVLGARTNVPSYLFFLILFPPSYLPCRPAPWPVPHRTPVGPVLRVPVNQTLRDAGDTSAMQLGSGKACAGAAATAGCAHA